MLTAAMPALTNALRGVLPPNALKQLTQALGNCNQDLTHRGNVVIQPDGWLNRANNNGVFDTLPPTSREYNEYVTPYLPGGGDAINSVYNNSYNTNIDYGDVVTVLGGPPGSDGRDGRAGVDGVAGVNGLDGRDGSDGSDGAPGSPSAAGAAGAAGAAAAGGAGGAAGAPGDPGAAGAAGRDGRDGAAGRDGAVGVAARNGLGGGYRLNPKNKTVTIQLDKVTVKQKQIDIQIPKYKFDSEACDMVADGTETVPITVPDVEVEEGVTPYNFTVPDPTLAPKAGYP
jgi:hypothetical protein